MVRMTRVRAPELRGRGWLNTGGRELKLADFRDRILILDFWSSLLLSSTVVSVHPVWPMYVGNHG